MVIQQERIGRIDIRAALKIPAGLESWGTSAIDEKT